VISDLLKSSSSSCFTLLSSLTLDSCIKDYQYYRFHPTA
jgi:hypothetical protein